MCGEFGFVQVEKKKIKEIFGVKKFPTEFTPKERLFPGNGIYIIKNDTPQEVIIARWGLIPFFAKEENQKYSTYNARLETVDKLPTYRKAFKSQHCLILADSFIEYSQAKDPQTGKKKKCQFALKDGGIFAFAGLWDVWGDKKILSTTIITTTPNKEVGKVHSRMPVILKPNDYSNWLDSSLKNSKSILISNNEVVRNNET